MICNVLRHTALDVLARSGPALRVARLRVLKWTRFLCLYLRMNWVRQIKTFGKLRSLGTTSRLFFLARISQYPPCGTDPKIPVPLRYISDSILSPSRSCLNILLRQDQKSGIILFLFLIFWVVKNNKRLWSSAKREILRGSGTAFKQYIPVRFLNMLGGFVASIKINEM